MKIAPLSNPLHFATTKRTTYKAQNKIHIKPFYDREMSFLNSYNDRQIVSSNSTRFFREDINWKCLAERLDELFSDTQKVNTYNFACSDGSEPYSLAISLIEILGEEKAKKFFPIKANDIDPFIIKKAQSGRIKANQRDIDKLENITQNNIEKYFKVTKWSNDEYILTAKEILKDNIIFEQGDFTKSINTLNPSNNLILCRNFWAYLNPTDIYESAKTLHKKLDESSIMLIGAYDMQNRRAPFFLEQLGFDCATDYYMEEYILKNNPIFHSAQGKNKELMLKYIAEYISEKRF